MAKDKKAPGKLEIGAGDTAHVVVKAALSAIPVAGGPLAELFAFLVAEPVSKRRDAWIEQIAGDIEKLQDHVGRPILEQLKDDESFTTTLLNASQAAMRTHEQAKIKLLANAVINAALGVSPDDLERAIFLELVSRLHPAHVALLALMQAPMNNRAVADRMTNITGGGIMQVISIAFPDLGQRQELVKIIWSDLADAGLIEGGGLGVTMTGGGMVSKRTTELGDRFLRFVEEPKFD